MAPRQYVDISHFRAPYKNWPYLGMGGFGQMDPSMPIDVSAPPVPDSTAVTPITPASTVASLVTVDADGVKTLLPAVGIMLATLLQAVNFVPFTTATDKEQIIIGSVSTPPVAGHSAMDWVNTQLAKGRSVIVSTNDSGGLASVIGGTMSGQTMLISVSTKADEIAAAGPSMPSAALITASKLKPSAIIPGALQKAGLGPSSVALIALAVVGGGVLLITRRKKHAVSNRRRRSRR